MKHLSLILMAFLVSGITLAKPRIGCKGHFQIDYDFSILGDEAGKSSHTIKKGGYSNSMKTWNPGGVKNNKKVTRRAAEKAAKAIGGARKAFKKACKERMIAGKLKGFVRLKAAYGYCKNNLRYRHTQKIGLGSYTKFTPCRGTSTVSNRGRAGNSRATSRRAGRRPRRPGGKGGCNAPAFKADCNLAKTQFKAIRGDLKRMDLMRYKANVQNLIKTLYKIQAELEKSQIVQ